MTDYKIERLLFDKAAVTAWQQADKDHVNWPVVYTISDSEEIYVGETVNAASRMQQHLATPGRSHLERVQIIVNKTFNKSVCLDLESQLIRYFAADEKFKVLNLNTGISDANYFDRDKYRQDFDELFKKLYEDGFLTRPVPEIVNSNLFKYSPFKALNTDQAVALTGIMERFFSIASGLKDDEIVVRGDPGTGKTIVAIYLIKLLMDIANHLPDDPADKDSIFNEYFAPEYKVLVGKIRIGLVIPQQSLRKTVQIVFDQTPGLEKGMVLSPFDVGHATEKFDLLVVDEAHRLGQRANQSSASQNTAFSEINLRLFGDDDKSRTQLEWIRKQSKARILLVDAAQSIKPADLPLAAISKLISAADSRDALFHLSSQMRVAGGSDYIEFAQALLSQKPTRAADFGSYDLRFFDNFKSMRDAIDSRNNEHELARLVAGFAWPWASKKNKARFDIEIEGSKLFWNRTATDWINSKTSIEEVGSIHTVQGYDLNYAGVIIGPDIKWDSASQRIVFDRKSYFDVKGRENNPTLGIKYTDEDILQYVLNIYRVLLTRGVKGTYVYVYDPGLRAHLKQFMTN
jgi:hypothetical protein